MVRLQMRKQIIFMVVGILLMLSLVSAEEVCLWKRGDTFTVELAMGNANLSKCTSCTCEVTIIYPNGSMLARNHSGTNIAGYCQYSNITNAVGSHTGEVIFTDGTDYGRSTFECLSTTTGEKVGLSNIILAIIYIIMALIFLGLAYSFNLDHWMIKTFFNFCAVLMGILALNAGKIVASESLNLSRMGEVGLTVMYAVLSIFFLYIFIFVFIDLIKAMKKKEAIRWDYD